MALTLDGTNGVTFPSGSGTQAAQSKVLQVVNATYSTSTSSTTSTYVDTGLTASITPLFSTSKVLVIVNQNGLTKYGSDTALSLQLLKNGTLLTFIGNLAGTGSSAENDIGSATISYLDSPATTSSVTYKTQFRSISNTATVAVQYQSGTSTITLMEIAA
jgi:hypothetical protein